MFLKVVLNISLFVLIPLTSLARPEYAAVNRMQCSMCHQSTVGGGIRNMTGKAFGFRGYAAGPYSNQDFASLDVRTIYYAPESENASGGMGTMAAVAAVALPVMQEESGKEVTLVYSQSIGGFPSGTRMMAMDSFLKFKNYGDGEIRWYPQYVSIGRFHAPFGVLTDEHRTFTKMLAKSTWIDLEMGGLFSSEITSTLHYDIALVNGSYKDGGKGFTSEGATLWGSVSHLRWSPIWAPVTLGVSHSVHKVSAGGEDRTASAVYSIMPLQALSGDLINGSVILEYAQSKNWNGELSSYKLISDPSYEASVATTESQGYLIQMNWDLADRWVLNYKYDWLALNTSHPEDAYERHGVGAKYYFGPNAFVMTRYDKAVANHPLEKVGNKIGNMSATWILLQIAI